METYHRQEIVLHRIVRLERPPERSGILTPDHIPTFAPLRFSDGQLLLRFRFSANLLILSFVPSATGSLLPGPLIAFLRWVVIAT